MAGPFGDLADSGVEWGEQTAGIAPHSVWATLAWILSIMAGLGIITGALFLMPAVSAFVGSFFVDEVAEKVELKFYPDEPPGQPLPVFRGLIEGINSLVQAAKAKARGYRNRKTLKAVTYLIAGRLDLKLPT